jgi:hypothetical protein
MTHDFKRFDEILENFHLKFRFDEFINFREIQPVEPEQWFESELKFSLKNRGEDDKEFFTSEFIIVPFLKEIWKRYPRLNLFSHVQIKADDLTVIPDYLLSSKSETGYKTVKKPLLLTVEAKNEKFDEGWCQALLQSVVCRKINDTDEIPIFSIVTTGDVWQFGKFEKESFIRHPVAASIQNITLLLGMLDVLFSECEKNAYER